MYTLLGFISFVVASCSVVIGDMKGPASYFHVSIEVIILASVTTFVIGFGVSPCVFASLSEEVGRQISICFNTITCRFSLYLVPWREI